MSSEDWENVWRREEESAEERKPECGQSPQGKSFRIRTPFPAPADGELRCFLNDVPLLYWNNRGVTPLRIVEVGREAGERREASEGE